jgi:hypothetical protein
MGRGQPILPSGYVCVTEAARLAHVGRDTLYRAIRLMRLPAFCSACSRQLTKQELRPGAGHACSHPSTWLHRGFRVMLRRYDARRFRADPDKVRAGRARWGKVAV